MQKVVVFGTGKIADALYQTVLVDAKPRVVIEGFCVDGKYRNVDRKFGLPVVDFETIQDHYPPDQYGMIVAIGYHDLNRVREEKYKRALEMGYILPGYINSDVMLTKDAIIGRNVLVFNNVLVGPGASIGDDTVIFPGAIVSHHAKIGMHNWITSGTVIGGQTTVGDNCFLGINSSIGHNINIGNLNFIGSRTVVTKSTEDKGVYIEADTHRYRLDSERFVKMFNFV